MLAHMKAKRRESPETTAAAAPVETPAAITQAPPTAGIIEATTTTTTIDGEKSDTQVTCDVLCSLGASYGRQEDESPDCSISELPNVTAAEKRKWKSCPKQHQLPMFLSKTYHMIDRCDPAIATWSAAGDNFVVKNVEQFASHVLPLYFKHSNFSSFARQLNFYGFRKLRTDPILTSDVDPRTACYVRFYHDKFQKDRPELLHQIKRATKSDQQSKDDVESLKLEVMKLNECIGQMSSNMDRKLAEMSYEYNRRITTLSAEYDKLAVLVTQILARQQQDPSQPTIQLHVPTAVPAVPTAAPAGVNPPPPPSSSSSSATGGVPDLMHSLSQVAAISLQNHLQQPPTSTSPVAANGGATITAKRAAPEEAGPSTGAARQRTSY